MTVALGAVLVLALIVFAALLLSGGATPLPRWATIDDRRPQRPPSDFEIAVTDHRGDVEERSSPSLRTWLTAGGALVAAVVLAIVGSEI